MSVLCLIANPADPVLSPDQTAGLAHELGGELNWLAQGIACEIIAPKSTDALAQARHSFAGQPVDVVQVRSENRRKRLLIADMDSTMIEQECIDELADALGLKPQIAEITARAMNGELDFVAALETRVALLKGLEKSVVEEVRRERITLAPGGRTLVQTMKAYGGYTSLVSGGFTLFADFIAKRLGFDEAVANVLEFDNEVLAGTVRPPIVDKDTKLKRLKTLAAQHELALDQTIAVGDGANDLPMLKAAGLGVAMHAKPSVAAEVNARIDHADLTALLYLQGYSEEAFVR